MAGRSNQGIKNLQSTGRTAIRVTGRTTDKAAVGLARWATTDHSGIGRTLENMHLLGIQNTIKAVLVKFILHIAGAVLTVIWVMDEVAHQGRTSSSAHSRSTPLLRQFSGQLRTNSLLRAENPWTFTEHRHRKIRTPEHEDAPGCIQLRQHNHQGCHAAKTRAVNTATAINTASTGAAGSS
jgi:hypothetical protein